jgi:tRNA A37 threonylcarbamoyladenosine modification protein TsaB
MHKDNVDVVLIALSSPIMIGIYKDNILIDAIESQEKSSEILPILYKEIFLKYNVDRLLYANGPGSFMAIKVSYVFLKSLSILKGIPLFATDAFYFNENNPIKAMGKLYFVKIRSQKIETKKIESVVESKFTLPDILDYDKFSSEAEPLYHIGSVG